MQAMILIAVFSLVFAIAGSIVVGSGVNTQQLTRMRVQEMQEYFEAVETVMRDITRNKLELAPAGVLEVAPYIRSTQDLMQLSTGRWADPALDAWGNEIKGYLVRENRIIYVNGTDQVVAVVTGVALISAGPDRTLQTIIPTTSTIAAMQGMLPPLGSDDIVRVFTDETTQRENWEGMMVRMQRIANAELNDFQMKLYSYQNELTVKYQQELAATGTITTPDLQTMLATDPNAPKFIDISVANNRLSLGVDDDFSMLERPWGNGGRMKISSITNPDGSLTLQLQNDPANPTVWGSPSNSLKYSLLLKGGL